MSAAFAEPQIVEGPGWSAEVHGDRIALSVAPEGDPLPKAVRRLFASSQRRYWFLTWTHEDARGWDCYELTRLHLAAVPLIA